MSIEFSDSCSHNIEEAQLFEAAPSRDGVVSHSEFHGQYDMLPLDRDRQELRLLELLPSESPAGQIECKLYVVSRIDAPIYSALSYTWGSGYHEVPIFVNNRRWIITENLFSALTHLRNPIDPRILWVDAICINQHDDDEKSWHVQEMRQTFEEAKEALVWLGPSSSGSDDALNMLNQIAENMSPLGKPQDIWSESVSAEIAVLLQEAAQDDGETQQPHAASRYDKSLAVLIRDIVTQNKNGHHFVEPATFDLFSRRWWNRVWVLQELAVSREAQMICGHATISRANMEVAAALYYQYRTSLGLHRSQLPLHDLLLTPIHMTMQKVYVQFILRWSYVKLHASLGVSLSFLLSSTFAYGSTRVLEASDPRDYVFALYGLVGNISELGLVANYSKSNFQIYIDLTWALIKHGHFMVLSWCRSQRVEPSSLPSWVPDFTHRIQRPFQWTVYSPISNTFVMQPEYSSSMNVRGPAPELLSPQSDNVLRMHGVLVDTVATCGASWQELYERQFHQPSTMARISVRWLKEVKMLIEEFKHSNHPASLREQSEAVWRSSVADMEMSPSWERRRRTCSIAEAYIDMYMENFPYEKTMNLENITSHFHLMESTNMSRRPFLSAKGNIGLGPIGTKPGDDIVVFSGVQMPLTVRSRGDGQYTLVGDTYLDGIMDGAISAGFTGCEAFHIS